MNDDRGREVAATPPNSSLAPWRQALARNSGVVYGLWTAAWIGAFALRQPEIGLPMMFATGALAAVIEPGRRQRRRRGRRIEYWGRPDLNAGPPPVVPPVTPEPVPASSPAPERRLAAAVVRAETNAPRLGDASLALVRELDGLLRPMLADRQQGVDPGVRHDVEAIAGEHLPAVLDAYLAVPADAAHERLGADGSTPADELRSQLTLLVEGTTQLRDAIRAADVSRQQQLGRFLDAKFGRSDLDL